MKCQNQISDQRMSDIYGLGGIDITGWVEQETQARLFKLELGIKTVRVSPLSEIPVHLITTSWDQFWSRSEDGKAIVAHCRAAFGCATVDTWWLCIVQLLTFGCAFGGCTTVDTTRNPAGCTTEWLSFLLSSQIEKVKLFCFESDGIMLAGKDQWK